MKRIVCVLLLLIAVFSAGCSDRNAAFDVTKAMVVISREAGSGTHAAFIALLGIEHRDGDTRTDRTTKEAIVTTQTGAVMQNIAGDKYAMGYISIGSLNDTVKAVQINGVSASAEHIKSNDYPLVRPFHIATYGVQEGVAADFIAFILSAEGQAVVAGRYIAMVDHALTYEGAQPSGRIVVGGSSSVTPVMEQLKEAYAIYNPNATIEIQQSDSTTGITSVLAGSYDIAMVSRDLNDKELEQLTQTQIAWDGIAVIINHNNPLTSLTADQLRDIYMGQITRWSELQP